LKRDSNSLAYAPDSHLTLMQSYYTGPTHVDEIDETAPDPVPETPSPYNVPLPVTPHHRNLVDTPPETPNPYNVPLPATPGNMIESIPETPTTPCNIPLPGTPLDRDCVDNAGAEGYESSADGESKVDTLIV
jgi:hypothetical protein